jgi:diadenosine tetraphosphatase ApaH/serine/threonine PP2A family protein phosphatase
MRTAFFADVHSNREALTACMEHAREQGAERNIYLGDLVGYGADPGWVIDTASADRDQGGLVLQGNHDAAVYDLAHRPMHPEAEGAIDWTRNVLAPAQIEFLRDLPFAIEEGDTLYVHANAWAPAAWGYIARSTDARFSMEATHCRYTFCGHMHDPVLYHLASTGYTSHFNPVSGTPIPLSRNRRWLSVTGSVGQPRDGNPAASYALLDHDTMTLTYFRIPYDVATAAAKIIAAGLPPGLARRLEQAF